MHIPNRRSKWLPAVALLYALAARVYFVARHEGRWLDGDTVGIARDADRIWSGAGLPGFGDVLGSSFGQPVLLGYWSRALGISTAQYQQLVHPLVGMVIVLAAYVVARRVWSDPVKQAIAVFLLATAPEVFFETVRGSHGAFAQSATLLLTVSLLPIVLRGRRAGAAWLLLSMALGSAVFLMNGRRGLMVSGALGAAVLLFAATRRWMLRPQERKALALAGVALALGVAVLGVVVATYWQTVAPLLARPSEVATLQGYGGATWKSPLAYIALAAWNPLVALAAAATWVVLARRFLRGRAANDVQALWVWALAFGFGLVVLIAGLGGYVFSVFNFVYPLRAFAYACMVFAFLATLGFAARGWNRRSRLAIVTGVLVVALFAVAAPLKSSGEPALNRHWRFSDQHEAAALLWLATWRDPPPVWAESESPQWESSRLANTYYRVAPIGVWPLEEWRAASAPAVLWSPTVAAHARETGTPLPSSVDYHQVYDNGGAEVWLRV